MGVGTLKLKWLNVANITGGLYRTYRICMTFATSSNTHSSALAAGGFADHVPQQESEADQVPKFV